ncbi:MAG TPA: asparagine synthase (glutamine-hydrolyzing) [Candidatus Limnocylindrales bacterium]
MCGIAGAIERTQRGDAGAVVRDMLGVLEHRGPDDRGCAEIGRVAIGQRRLSILDTSSSGHQPMRSADDRLWIVHNGEIYNFLELAAELRGLGHRFRSETDTEVILAAYAEWGLDALRRFNGIWAFALWDARAETLVLSRDRFGVKPLYVAEHGNLLGFASEIKALLTMPGMTAEPEPAAIRDFLVDGIVDHSDQSFYRGISRIPPAHSLVLTPTGRRTIRYWGPPTLADDTSHTGTAADAGRVEEIRDLVVDAVALQLRSDVALGTCLSGGMDSSSIVGVASAVRDGRLTPASSDRHRDARPQKAFFAEFRVPGLDERHHVDSVVAQTGVELHTVTPSFDDFSRTLPEVLEHQDEPFGSASVLAQYHVMRLARASGVTVLLDGQGADEIFGGYPPFAGPRYAGLLRSGSVGGVLSALRDRETTPRALVRYGVFGPQRLPWLLQGRRNPSWLGPTARRAGTLWPAPVRRSGTFLAQVLWDQISVAGLSGLLRYEDRNSMAFGIEARVPFLDHRLVEAALLLPDRLKIGRARRKIALARAMRGIVPDSVLQRRDKIAFAPPQDTWLRQAVPMIRRLAADSVGEDLGYLRAGTIADRLDRFENGSVAHQEMWRIMIVEMWLRRVLGRGRQIRSDGP